MPDSRARASFVLVLVVWFTVLLGAGSLLAQADRDCPDFRFQEDAQAYFDARGGSPTNNVDRLDADGDGIACERNPRRGAAAPNEQPVADNTGGPRSPRAPRSPGQGGQEFAPIGTESNSSGRSLPRTGAATIAVGVSGLSFLALGSALMRFARRWRDEVQYQAQRARRAARARLALMGEASGTELVLLAVNAIVFLGIVALLVR